jgi:glutathione S-transferase
VDELTLFVCHLDQGGPPVHPCRLAHHALRKHGHEYKTVVLDRNRPFGLFTSGKRPELKEMSGQEKLPVLRLPDGTTVNGSRAIIRWARETAPAQAPTT